MNRGEYPIAPEDYGLCVGVQSRVHIEIGDNGYSLCRSDHSVMGDCLIEGIQDIGIAHELTEMLIGELEEKALNAQQNPSLIFG
ncbi:MAG: hypothetical protein HQM02_05020 [Magnetococcales bacterium]|nr:hypothetical protein [Magnetococcales bacterium]